MKRGTTPTLTVSINYELSNIDHVHFLFKRDNSEAGTTLIEKTCTAGEGTENEGASVFALDFSEADTRLLPGGSVYMDTRIVTRDGKIPPTSIVQLDVEMTLFGETEAQSHD